MFIQHSTFVTTYKNFNKKVLIKKNKTIKQWLK